jgi:hypothetical protein
MVWGYPRGRGIRVLSDVGMDVTACFLRRISGM